MGKAIMGVVIGAGIIFAIVAYFSQIAWPEAYANIEDPDTGIFELFPHIGMSWLGTVFFIVDNCGSFVCALAGMGAVSRILYGWDATTSCLRNSSEKFLLSSRLL